MPNKLPGRTGDTYPSFLPAHAAAAQRHAQAAQHANQAALMAAGQHNAAAQDSARLVRERALITAAAARFAGGAAAVTAGTWQQEAAYGASMKALAEQTQVCGCVGRPVHCVSHCADRRCRCHCRAA
jgi:hypothetical protein